MAMSAGKSGVQGITIPRISFTINQPSRLPDTISGAGEGQTKKGGKRSTLPDASLGRPPQATISAANYAARCDAHTATDI